MKFTPYTDKIVVKPFDKKSIIMSDAQTPIEKGEVLTVGAAVTFFVPGDIVHFLAYGASEVELENGEKYCVVSVNEGVILGREAEVKDGVVRVGKARGSSFTPLGPSGPITSL